MDRSELAGFSSKTKVIKYIDSGVVLLQTLIWQPPVTYRREFQRDQASIALTAKVVDQDSGLEQSVREDSKPPSQTYSNATHANSGHTTSRGCLATEPGACMML